LVELGPQDRVKARPVAEDIEQLADACRQPFKLCADFVAAERGKAMQPELEDRLYLRFGQAVFGASLVRLDRFDERDVRADLLAWPFPRKQLFAGLGRRLRAADQLDDLVEVGD